MGAFLLGPFMIKHIYIVFLIAAITSYYMMKWSTKTDKSFQQIFLNTMINSAFIWFFTFKLSIILFQPMTILKNPVSILYFTGGTKGLILGLFLAFIYIFWAMKKRKIHITKWITPFVYGLVTFFLSFWISRTLLLFFL